MADNQLHVDLQIYDGTEWHSFGPYVESIDVELGDVSAAGSGQAGGDEIVRTLNFTLLNEGIVGTADHSPYLYDENDHPFEPRYRVTVQTAYTAVGVEPSSEDWEWIFDGYLGDRIEIDGYTIQCHCRDKAMLLQDYYIVDPEVFPKNLTPTYIEIEGEERELYAAPLVIQEILDYYSDDIGNIDLLTPDLTDNQGDWQYTNPEGDHYVFAIEHIEDDPWGLEYQNLFDGLLNACRPSGHFLGYLYDEDSDLFRLTYKEPPIDKTTPDHSFNWLDDIKVESLDTTIEDVRNYVKVVYGPEHEDEDTGETWREYVVKSDSDSISRYGKRSMLIEEGDTRFVNTEMHAEQFAAWALHDLSHLTATHQVDMFYNPDIRLFDLIEIDNPLVASSKFEIAVESVRHELRFGESPVFETSIIGSREVVGGRKKWLDREARPGAKSPIDEDDISTNIPIAKPRNLEVESLPGGIGVSFSKPVSHKWRESEIFADTEVALHPSQDNLVSITRSTESEFYKGFSPGTIYYIGVRHVDTSGNKSELAISDAVEVGDEFPAPDPDIVDIEKIVWLADTIRIYYALPDEYDEIEVRLNDDFGAEDEF